MDPCFCPMRNCSKLRPPVSHRGAWLELAVRLSHSLGTVLEPREGTGHNQYWSDSIMGQMGLDHWLWEAWRFQGTLSFLSGWGHFLPGHWGITEESRARSREEKLWTQPTLQLEPMRFTILYVNNPLFFLWSWRWASVSCNPIRSELNRNSGG
jgi:hypothetical protein